MGPDEYHASTDNNVYTNVVAGLSIYLAEFAHCVGGCPQLPPSWTQVPKRLHPYILKVRVSRVKTPPIFGIFRQILG